MIIILGYCFLHMRGAQLSLQCLELRELNLYEFGLFGAALGFGIKGQSLRFWRLLYLLGGLLSLKTWRRLIRELIWQEYSG